MKKVVIAIIVLAVLVGGFLLLSEPSTEDNAAAQESSQSLSMETINEDVSNGALLVDVRTPEEYQASYIESAENFPLSQLQEGLYPTKNKDRKIYVYCRSGNRSAQAAKILKDAGYSDVVDLGGIEDVVDLGGNKVN